jgi:hypothetical protein
VPRPENHTPLSVILIIGLLPLSKSVLLLSKSLLLLSKSLLLLRCDRILPGSRPGPGPRPENQTPLSVILISENGWTAKDRGRTTGGRGRATGGRGRATVGRGRSTGGRGRGGSCRVDLVEAPLSFLLAQTIQLFQILERKTLVYKIHAT